MKYFWYVMATLFAGMWIYDFFNDQSDLLIFWVAHMACMIRGELEGLKNDAR